MMLYAPIPSRIPHILAPASPTSSPPPEASALGGPAFGIPPKWQAGVDRLVALDAPRRKYGLPHLRPPRLGLPQLVCTSGINGLWRPNADHGSSEDGEPNDIVIEDDGLAWSDEENRLPRDEAEAKEWAQRRRLRRQARKAVATIGDGPAPRGAIPQLSAQPTAGKPPLALYNRAPPTVPKSRSASRQGSSTTVAAASTSSSRTLNPQHLVTSHFTATKTVSPGVAAAQQVKKRPAGSPPPNPPLSRASSHTTDGRASKRAVSPASSRKTELQSLVPETVSNVDSAASTRYTAQFALGGSPAQFAAADDDGALEEVLEEFGCTQPAFADPTQSRQATASTTASSRGKADVPPLPFSSPGLRDEFGDNARASTPARRPESIPFSALTHFPSPHSLPTAAGAQTDTQSKRPSGEGTPRPQPPTRTTTTDSTASGLGPPTLTYADAGQRKSLARLGSASSLRAGPDVFGGAGANGAESLDREAELEDIERFLQVEISQ